MKTIQPKKYFWSLFGVIGLVAFWAGIWDGIGGLPYLSNPLISLFLGLIILISTGLLFKEFNPLTEKKETIYKTLLDLTDHPQKEEFHIKYYDKVQKKHIAVRADKLKTIEKLFLVLIGKEQEEFIPVHRVKEITHKGKTHWKNG